MALICWLLSLYLVAILGRVLLSWFPLNPSGPMATVAGFLYTVTDPAIAPVRSALPPVRFGGAAIDLSPVIAFIGISILQRILCG